MPFSKLSSAIKHDIFRQDRYKMWAVTTVGVALVVGLGIPVVLTASDGAKGAFLLILLVMVYIFGMIGEVKDVLRQEDERLVMEKYRRSCDEYKASLDQDPTLDDEARHYQYVTWCRTTAPIRS